MANRTDTTRVCTVLDTDVSVDIVAVFISTANTLVTEYLGTAALSAALLAEIETYLAAHFVAVHHDRQAASDEADGVKVKYQGDTGSGLDATHFGQTAQMLDTTGTLASISDDDRMAFLAQANSEITNTRISA